MTGLFIDSARKVLEEVVHRLSWRLKDPGDEPLPAIPEVDLIGVYPRDSAWGNRIVWDDYERGHGRVHGWKEVSVDGLGEKQPELVGTIPWRTVRDGDRFGYEMESDYVAVFELENVKNERDPADMFFADAHAVGVLEEVDGA